MLSAFREYKALFLQRYENSVIVDRSSSTILKKHSPTLSSDKKNETILFNDTNPYTHRIMPPKRSAQQEKHQRMLKEEEQTRVQQELLLAQTQRAEWRQQMTALQESIARKEQEHGIDLLRQQVEELQRQIQQPPVTTCTHLSNACISSQSVGYGDFIRTHKCRVCGHTWNTD